jgi:hypothetical protein
MTDYKGSTNEQLTLFDDIDVNINYKKLNITEMSFKDITHVFNRFIVDNSENTKFNVNSLGIITPYIKRINNEQILLSDWSNFLITFRDKSKDNIELDDNVISHLTTSQNTHDHFVMRTGSSIDVKYGPDTVDSNSQFLDNVFAMISKHSDRSFKNATYNFLGTTEVNLYSCLGISSTIINISVCNRILSDIFVDIILYKGGVPLYISKQVQIKPKQSYVINNNNGTNIELEKNDEIRLISTVDNSSDVYIALMERN